MFYKLFLVVSVYFQTFLDILDIIIRIFRYFNICGKKIIKKLDLLEDIKMLQVDFVMIYIIYKISESLKITWITFKIFKRFFKEYNRLFFEKIFFFHNI